MQHCVFTNEYYLKADSLILSATIDGKRIETIEVSLKRMEVVQSRGAVSYTHLDVYKRQVRYSPIVNQFIQKGNPMESVAY